MIHNIMNIFFLSFIPQLCAQMHCDLHVIKMIVESAQLLSTCYRWLNGQRPKLKAKKLREELEREDPVTYQDDTWIEKCEQECGMKPYRMSHMKHGSAIWLRQRQSNFIWLANLALELCREKRVRWPDNPAHSTEPLIIWFYNNPPKKELFKDLEIMISPPYLAISDFWNCKVIGESDPYKACIKSYHKYYKAKEQIGVVYYRKHPERKPDWLEKHPCLPEERINIIKKKLKKTDEDIVKDKKKCSYIVHEGNVEKQRQCEKNCTNNTNYCTSHYKIIIKRKEKELK